VPGQPAESLFDAQDAQPQFSVPHAQVHADPDDEAAARRAGQIVENILKSQGPGYVAPPPTQHQGRAGDRRGKHRRGRGRDRENRGQLPGQGQMQGQGPRPSQGQNRGPGPQGGLPGQNRPQNRPGTPHVSGGGNFRRQGPNGPALPGRSPFERPSTLMGGPVAAGQPVPPALPIEEVVSQMLPPVVEVGAVAEQAHEVSVFPVAGEAGTPAAIVENDAASAPRENQQGRSSRPGGRWRDSSESTGVVPQLPPANVRKVVLLNSTEPGEIRVAILENNELAEIFMERKSRGQQAGNIYKGRVVNVEPSLQAAFIDLGTERNGFLHASDCIPPTGGYEDIVNLDRSRDRAAKQPPPPRVQGQGQGQKQRYNQGGRPATPQVPPPAAVPQAIAAVSQTIDVEAQAPVVPSETQAVTAPENIAASAAPVDSAAPLVVVAVDVAPAVVGDALPAQGEQQVAVDAAAPQPVVPGQPVAGPQAQGQGQGGFQRPEGNTGKRRRRRRGGRGRSGRMVRPPDAAPMMAPAPRNNPDAAPQTAESPASVTPVQTVDENAAGAAEVPACAPQNEAAANSPHVREAHPAASDAPVEAAAAASTAEPAAPEVVPAQAEPVQSSQSSEADDDDYDDEDGDDNSDHNEDEGKDGDSREEDGGEGRDRDNEARADSQDDDGEVDEGASKGDDAQTQEVLAQRVPIPAPGQPPPAVFAQSGRKNGGGRSGRERPHDRRYTIQEMLREGQEVLIQVAKEGIGQKGPALTTYISMPGRYLVLMPAVQRLGVSKRIESEEQRRTLKDALAQLNPPDDMGVIVRTAGMGRNKDELQRDMDYLMRVWDGLKKKARSVKAPAMIYQEGDVVTRVFRDVLTDDVAEIIIDDPVVLERAKEFLRETAPGSEHKLKLYAEAEPLFHKYGVEQQMQRLFNRKVNMRSGGSIVIEQTEALVAIDVNTGRFREKRNQDDTILQTNLEAAREIARQLRLRDIGGLVMIDFIDMEIHEHRRRVERELKAHLARDKARINVLPISSLGVVEMTRQRIRHSLRKTLFDRCPHCSGSGHIKSAESIGLELLREIKSQLKDAQVRRLKVLLNSQVAFQVLNQFRKELARLEEAKGITIEVCGDPGVSLSQMQVSTAKDGGEWVLRKVSEVDDYVRNS
jgi:ribonuclease E